MAITGPFEVSHSYTGLSTDTKPLDAKGNDRFFATDIRTWFIYDGSAWTQMPSGSSGGGGVDLYATSTNPASSVAVTATIIDAYNGVIITTTGAGNAQTMASPTITTSGKQFVVINNDTSTHSIAVNSIILAAGDAQIFIWDGTVWIAVEMIDATTTSSGMVTLATGAEAVTGSNATKAITPSTLTSRLAAPGAIGNTTPNTIISTGITVPTIDSAANASSFYTNIPVSGTDAIVHTSSHMIDGNAYIYAQATGDGAGGVSVNTIGIGVTGNADVIHIGDANALVDITDAHWSITEAGVLSIVSMGANWTNAGRTVADAGILTTVDINGGTVDGVTIGGATPAVGTFTTNNATTFDTNVIAAGVTLAGITLSADGTDADISITITPKGTGSVVMSKVDINDGTIDATDITVGASTSLIASAGTMSIPQKTPVNAVAATGTITVDGLNLADQTFVVGATTFTFVVAGTDPGNVVVDANTTTQAANIVTSINRDMVTVTATNIANVAYLVAVTKGTAGNNLDLTEATANLSLSGAKLAGGIDGTVGILKEICADTDSIYVATAVNTIADANWEKVKINHHTTIPEVDGHASGALTIDNVCGTFVYNVGQGANNVSLALPRAAEGYSFIAQVGETQAGNTWKITAFAGDVIYLDGVAGTAGQSVIVTPAIGNFVTFLSFKSGASSYSWIAKTGIGTYSAGA